MGVVGFDRGRVTRLSLTVLLTYAVMLVILTVRGECFIGPEGAVDADFVNVWAAGKLAWQGSASAAYDWTVHRQMEVVGLGHDWDGYYGWHYPPMLLFAAAPLSLLSYLPAWLVWSLLTGAALVWALRRVSSDPAVLLLAMAAPTTVMCTAVGQNGFLTAALMAAALAFLERRPVLAGIFLGLLTYKPQFGVLFPIALLAGRHWRTFLSAGVTALVFAGASALTFGLDTWRAFFHSTGLTMMVLRAGAPGWHKLQSVFALLNPLGETAAWAGQAASAVMAALLVAWVFRRPLPFSLKAAVLAAAVPFATPYGYVYDLTVQAVAVAFLARDYAERGCDIREEAALLIAMLLPWLFQHVGSGTGLIGSAMLIGLALRRGRAPSFMVN